MKIAVVDGCAYYHFRALHGERYRPCFDEIIYVRDLPRTALDDFDAVVIPDRLHPAPLIAARNRIEQYLSRGGTVLAFGDTPAQAGLPGVAWRHCPTNFWWWKTPGASLGLSIARPDHPLFQSLSLKDVTWHVHGVYTPPPGAVSLVGVEGDGSVLYEDTVSTPGRLVLSSLDPFYHYGSYFMPATERFLDGFFKWLKRGVGRPIPPLEKDAAKRTFEEKI